MVLDHKVHGGMTLQGRSHEDHVTREGHTHLGVVPREDLLLHRDDVSLYHCQPLFLKPNLQQTHTHSLSLSHTERQE